MLKIIKRILSAVISLSIFVSAATMPYDTGYLKLVDIPGISSESFGVFTYINSGGSIAITGCDKTVTEAVIPAQIDGVPVTRIADSAFDDCSALVSVTIPNGVVEIGNYAFRGCTSLRSVSLPESLITLRYSVFSNCTSLVELNIPKTITALGNYMFYGCTSLSSVILPDSLRDIGAYAFYGCTALKNVDFGKGLRTVGEYAFSDCIALTSVNLPEGTVTLGGWAFSGCTALSGITLPDSVTEIGKHAFEGCAGINSVELPASLVTIGASAFKGTSILSISLPDGVREIGAYAFYGCMALSTFTAGDKLAVIGDYAFFGCTALSEVNLGTGLTEIGESAFRGCTALRRISLPDSLTVLGAYAFCGCSNLSYVRLGSIASIGSYAFYGCNALSDLSIPDTVSVIGSYAFSGCTALLSVRLPEGVREIGERAFQNCTGISEIIFPGTLEEIGDYALYDCISLRSVTIPPNVASVGSMAFYGCDKLETATVLTRSAEYGNIIFYGCDKLETVYGFAGSTIESYAQKRDLPFTVLEFTSVSISSPAQKTEYFIGDTLDTTGLKLTARLENDVQIEINGGFAAEYDFSSDGSKTVSILFADFICTYQVVVQKVEPVEIRLSGYTLADRYYIGDSLAGKINAIHVIYNNGAQETVTAGFSVSYAFDTPGESQIAVSYLDYTQYFTVQVAKVTAASLEVVSRPTKTQYFTGDQIELSGLVLRVRYNSGVIENISSGWTFTGSADNAGKQTITVEYGGIGTEIAIYVTEVKAAAIRIAAMPGQLTYYRGTALNDDGLVIAVDYNNGTSKEITSGWTLVYDFNETSGLVTVYYEELSATFNVNVIEDTLTGISINTAPTKTVYYLGESLDMTGLTLIARFESGAMEIISEGWTVSGNISSTGTRAISISYGIFKVYMNVTVLANYITSIAVQTLPVRTDYNSGDSLDTAGMTLLATYISGSTAVINGGWTTEYNFSIEGVRPVTVTYAGCQTTFDVNVSFTYIDNSFIFQQDNWSFINTVGAFGGGSYYLSNSDYEALMSQLSNTEKSIIESKIQSDWLGSCYGMATVALLAKIGKVKPVQWQTGADNLYQLPAPADNSVESLINYYQWLQHTKAVSQQMVVYSQLQNKDKIEDIVRMAKAVPTGGYPFLINFQHAGYDSEGEWTSWGHAIIGYGVAYGSWNYNGRTFDARILIYDPNCAGFMSSACLYFDTKTYDWLIPKSNTYYTAGDDSSTGRIILSTNNISVINYAGLSEGNQNYTIDCYTPILGTEWLDYYTLKRISVSPGPGVYQGANEEEKVTVLYDLCAEGAPSSRMNMVLADAQSGYILKTESGDLELDMSYEHSLLLLEASDAQEAAFRPEGEISFKGADSSYSMSMVFDEGYYDFPWYEIKVSGSDADTATLVKTGEGYLLKSDMLNNVSVEAYGNTAPASLTFSSDYDSVMIIALDGNRLGIYADTDANGTYETFLKDSAGNTQIGESAITGDVSMDGMVNVIDLLLLIRHITGINELNTAGLSNADCHPDEQIDLRDLVCLAQYISGIRTTFN